MEKSSKNKKMFEEMLFIYNALNNGWKIQKKNNAYIFSKKHNNKKSFFNKSFTNHFVNQNKSIHF